MLNRSSTVHKSKGVVIISRVIVLIQSGVGFTFKAVRTVSKVIAELILFSFTTLYDWFKKTRATYSSNRQWSHAFSRACRRLRVFSSNSHWFVLLFTFSVIGHCNCLGFGFTTLN